MVGTFVGDAAVVTAAEDVSGVVVSNGVGFKLAATERIEPANPLRLTLLSDSNRTYDIFIIS